MFSLLFHKWRRGGEGAEPKEGAVSRDKSAAHAFSLSPPTTVTRRRKVATIRTRTKRGMTVRYIHCKNDFNDLITALSLLPPTTMPMMRKWQPWPIIINYGGDEITSTYPIPTSLTSGLQHNKIYKDNNEESLHEMQKYTRFPKTKNIIVLPMNLMYFVTIFNDDTIDHRIFPGQMT